MANQERWLLSLAGFILALALILIADSGVWAQESLFPTSGKQYTLDFPLIASPPDPFTDEEEAVHFLNYMRFYARVPAAVIDPDLNDNCFEHARYMAENDLLAHQQNPRLPYSSTSGQICAKKANTWLGTQYPIVPWKPIDSLYSWRTSVAHRLWMIYPTTTVFGFGFYTCGVQRSGAALDVLSRANFDADEAYKGWPVRYPGAGQKNIPAIDYPITINWRYFGSKPVLNSVQLTTTSGVPIPFEANTDLEAGHKGIQILPKENLPENKIILVIVSGSYDGKPFTYNWRFTTGKAENVTPSMQSEPVIPQ